MIIGFMGQFFNYEVASALSSYCPDKHVQYRSCY